MNPLFRRSLLTFSTLGLAFIPITAPVRAEMSWLKSPDLPVLEPQSYLPQPDTMRLVIRLSKRRVYLYRGDEEIVSYPIAVGKAGWETPEGEFEVIQMLKDPSWEHPWNGSIVPPGPSNPLGDRWIGFWTDGKDFIGFHGTPGEHLVGQAVSHGCIRMLNNDVRALYEQVEIGMPVAVVQ
ncbi:MAG: L,D-transpeptidase [Cyanobacteria bacterium P01_H01_bin.15]